MKPPGTYKIRYQRAPEPTFGLHAVGSGVDDAIEGALYRIATTERRTRRIVDSISEEIRDGGGQSALRIRRVFQEPREIFRVEVERPDLGYQRTTLLGREALEVLLESDAVRSAMKDPASHG
jgi:hypothetical protein